jgi:hypothetical protein
VIYLFQAIGPSSITGIYIGGWGVFIKVLEIHRISKYPKRQGLLLVLDLKDI